mmetsp:Transcript_1696/g.3499  ORF Transcript_1696/g.3499 Transcript_1696/m.3499 type:complete len:104 (-) Transcript_1696:86-397(-)
MPLNPKAAEFQPSTWMSPRHGSGEKTTIGGYASYPVNIPLPDDPFAQEYDDMAISPDEAEELENVQSWVEMMADLEESEGDHLIAMALKFSDKKRIHELRSRA